MRKVWVFAAAISLVAPMTVLTAVPAGAVGGTICAKASGNIKLTPPVGSTPTKTKISLNIALKNCKGGGVTAGTITGSVTLTSTIATLATKPVKILVTIKWNNGKTSTSTFTDTNKIAGGVITATVKGKVSKGLFLGSSVTNTSKAKPVIAGGKATGLTLTNVTAFAIK